MNVESEDTSINNKLKLGLILNTSFTIFQFAIGIFSGSLALISDASHNLTDSLTIVISYAANKVSRKHADSDKTFGYARATILAALLNALILFGLAVYIFSEAYQRLQQPQPVEGKLVVLAALGGIIINGGIALLFAKNKNDLNIRSAFLNMILDALASVGVLIAGLIIVLTGKTFIDPLISVIIGTLLLYGGWSVVKSALHILLEGVPEGVDIKKVKEEMLKTPMVKGIDDLHIWALSTNSAALSCHIVIEKCSLEKSVTVIKKVKDNLREKFNIDHATIETELTDGPHDNERMDEGM